MALTAMAKAALQEALPRLADGVYAKRYGWIVDMDWDTGICFVTLKRPFDDGQRTVTHVYMLRITFDYYPIEQPGVLFVDPTTKSIGSSDVFERWWPNVDGNPHINIQIDRANPEKSYLCFQWTFEFKATHSAPEQGDPKKWDPEKHDVVGVARKVQQALNTEHYRGFRKQ